MTITILSILHIETIHLVFYNIKEKLRNVFLNLGLPTKMYF